MPKYLFMLISTYNIFFFRISEMEEEKNYIYTKTFNALKKHGELIEDTKELVKVYGYY